MRDKRPCLVAGRHVYGTESHDIDHCRSDLADAARAIGGPVELANAYAEAVEDKIRTTLLESLSVAEELERIEVLCAQARDHIEAEAEGDFSRDILELHTRAALLLHLVAAW